MEEDDSDNSFDDKVQLTNLTEQLTKKKEKLTKKIEQLTKKIEQMKKIVSDESLDGNENICNQWLLLHLKTRLAVQFINVVVNKPSHHQFIVYNSSKEDFAVLPMLKQLPNRCDILRKKSVIWLFFSVAEDSKYGVCTSWKQKLSREGTTNTFNTSNLVSQSETSTSERLSDIREAERQVESRSIKQRAIITKQLTLQESKDRTNIMDVYDPRA